MSSTTRALFLGLGLTIAISPATHADNIRPGQLEFQARCAACHGIGGLGDGPVGRLLKTPPPNLALIAQRNGGSFPFERVYDGIDGRAQVAAHGTRDMPIWGGFYRADMPDEATEEVMDAAEKAAEAEVLALVFYIGTLQTTQK